ncbi:MAG: hypothetical protein V4510_12890 [bacterium]
MRDRADKPRGLNHFRVLPFEALFGVLALVGGLLGLVHYGGTGGDAVSSLLPGWLTSAVQSAYALSGVAILAGLFKPRRDIETVGLSLLVATTVVRTVSVFAVLGLTDVSTLSFVFNALIIAASLARIKTIFMREVIIFVQEVVVKVDP